LISMAFPSRCSRACPGARSPSIKFKPNGRCLEKSGLRPFLRFLQAETLLKERRCGAAAHGPMMADQLNLIP